MSQRCDEGLLRRMMSRRVGALRSRGLGARGVGVGVGVGVGAVWLAVATLGAAAPSASAGGVEPARFVAVGPVRAADTRQPVCGCQQIGPTTIRVDLATLVPAGLRATAAAITLTATRQSDAGYATAFPANTPVPATSTVNFEAGVDVANSAIVALTGTALDVFVSGPSDLIVDITGLFVVAPAQQATAGRYQPVAPTRLLDTRHSSSGGIAEGGAVTAGLPPGVAADAAALVVNVTSVDARRPGHLSGTAAGSPPAPTSFLNVDGTGSARAVAAILPASASGITITSSAGGHVIVDLLGWMTGPSSPSSGEGLFVALSPQRLVDTRRDQPRVWPGGTREVAVPAFLTGVAGAVVTNVTATRADGAGYLTAWAAGTTPPATSTLNVARRDETRANLAVTGVSDRGLAYFADAGTDIVVDLTGWFTGSAVAATRPPAPNLAPPPRALIIGDSTLAILDVTTAARRALLGHIPIVDAQACRRLSLPSCQSRFTLRVPNTAVEAIRDAPGPLDMLVMRTGYNETSAHFEQSVRDVLAMARQRGIRTVIWLTYSEGRTNFLTYLANNATLAGIAPEFPEVVLADWRTYGALAPEWYAADRVHLQGIGGWATSDYISRWIAHVARRPCPMPWAPGEAIADPCPNPDRVAAERGVPDLRGLYGLR